MRRRQFGAADHQQPATDRGERQRRPLDPRRPFAHQPQSPGGEQEARDIAEQGGVAELGEQDPGVPCGEIGGEEEGGEQDRPDQRRARPAHRLADHQCDQEQERQRQRHPPETGGDRADPGMADEERAGGERDIANQQGEERPAMHA